MKSEGFFTAGKSPYPEAKERNDVLPLDVGQEAVVPLSARRRVSGIPLCKLVIVVLRREKSSGTSGVPSPGGRNFHSL